MSRTRQFNISAETELAVQRLVREEIARYGKMFGIPTFLVLAIAMVATSIKVIDAVDEVVPRKAAGLRAVADQVAKELEERRLALAALAAELGEIQEMQSGLQVAIQRVESIIDPAMLVKVGNVLDAVEQFPSASDLVAQVRESQKALERTNLDFTTHISSIEGRLSNVEGLQSSIVEGSAKLESITVRRLHVISDDGQSQIVAESSPGGGKLVLYGGFAEPVMELSGNVHHGSLTMSYGGGKRALVLGSSSSGSLLTLFSREDKSTVLSATSDHHGLVLSHNDRVLSTIGTLADHTSFLLFYNPKAESDNVGSVFMRNVVTGRGRLELFDDSSRLSVAVSGGEDEGEAIFLGPGRSLVEVQGSGAILRKNEAGAIILDK